MGQDLTPGWFEYRTRVQPHHTDYAGIAWHGTYVAWMEEARIAYLEAHDSSFADWIAAGVDLPVVDLALRYHRALPLGALVLIQTRFEQSKGVRFVWNYQILNADTQDLCVTAQVTLVPVDMARKKILRSLPPALADWVAKVQPPSANKT